jgi:hypothetical protein
MSRWSWWRLIHDGPPALRPIGGIDRVDHLVHLRLDLLVARQRAPARRRELHEHDALSILGVALEEPAERAEPLRQALGVVEPLDAHAEDLRGWDAQALQQGLARRRRRLVDEVGPR